MLKHRKIFIIAIIFALALMYGAPITNAASLTNAKDTISDSDVSVSATHTVAFTIAQALSVNEYIEVTFPAAFGDVLVGNITCPGSSTASAPSTEIARCTATGAIGAGALTVTVSSITNPVAAGSQSIDITTYTSGAVAKETIDVRVAIIDDVTVSATVSSTLTFEISPLNSGTSVNGAATTANSATTTLSFGTLAVGTPSIMGQALKVTTNADDGYTVTVAQDSNLTSGSGSDIDAFDDGVPGAAKAWEAPTGTLDQELTYGHMGLTSEDSNLSGGDTFGANLWAGFNGTTAVEVMYHDGPADGSTADKGATEVAYQIQVSALQEAGDYTNTLTYICTPTY